MWNYDILLAGFPCQPFSSQGNLEGFNDATKEQIMFNISLFFKINLMICINSSKIEMLKCQCIKREGGVVYGRIQFGKVIEVKALI